MKHQKKEDGTWNVKVRVSHKRDVAYISTPFFVVKGELNRKYEIVDDIIQTEVTNYVNDMRKALIELGVYVESFTAKSLAVYLKTRSLRGIKDKNAEKDKRLENKKELESSLSKLDDAGKKDSSGVLYSDVTGGIASKLVTCLLLKTIKS